jgi:hypothetical protein
MNNVRDFSKLVRIGETGPAEFRNDQPAVGTLHDNLLCKTRICAHAASENGPLVDA